MSQFDPYIAFDGQCAEAFRFYERVFGGTIETLLTYAEAPAGAGPPVAPGDARKVMHASLKCGDRVLMGSDWCMPGEPYAGLEGFSLSMTYPDRAAAERVFGALSDGGKVEMPLRETFWSPLFGVVTDRFGVSWMVSVEHKQPA